MSNFVTFNLDEGLLKVLNELNYEKPTSIQEQAIPKILAGLDVIASAQTGTGKTGAFMLPTLHLLATTPVQKSYGPQVLILVPTRELALQVYEETKKYSKYLPHIKTVCIYGGVPYPVQKRTLSSRYDILIATPGRLIDHLEQKRINLSQIKMLVLDEADRMLDMGFIDAVEQIINNTPKNRQTLLFSATINNKILPFSHRLQNNPHEIRVKPDLSIKDNIETCLYYVDDLHHKIRLLDYFLENITMTQMIVFASTIQQTKILARYLQEKDYLSGALHGDMDQKQRTKTINQLRRGQIQILVATDVASRGIDIASLSHVINFDLPFHPEDFIHRIGRTGRAGAKGVAITFATYREEPMLSKISRLMGKPLISHIIAGMEPKAQDNFTHHFSNHRRKPRPSLSNKSPKKESITGSPLKKEFKSDKKRPNDEKRKAAKPPFAFNKAKNKMGNFKSKKTKLHSKVSL